MIFCVEDDNNIRDLIIYTLKVSGFEAKGFESSKCFWNAIKEDTPELIILDIMLPEDDGLTILKKLRSSPSTCDIPVILATAKGSEYDKVIGLDTGADDYLVKPFGMMEMVSRIKAVLRRTSPKQTNILTYGSISLDESKHIVTVEQKPVTLTLKEYEILKLFMNNPGLVFSRDILLTKIWSMDYIGETRTIDVHIGTLRTKLGDAGDAIQTVRGVGYKLEEKDE